MLKKKVLSVFGIWFIFLIMSTQWNCLCAEDKWYAGLTGNVLKQNEEGMDTRTGFGFRFGRQFMKNYDLKLYALFTRVEDNSLGRSIEFRDDFAFISSNYHCTRGATGMGMYARI